MNNGRATVGVLTRQRLGVGTRLNEIDRPHKSRCGHSWLHGEAVLNDAAEARVLSATVAKGEGLGALAAGRHRPGAAVVGEGRVVGHDTASGGVESVNGLTEATHVERARSKNPVRAARGGGADVGAPIVSCEGDDGLARAAGQSVGDTELEGAGADGRGTGVGLCCRDDLGAGPRLGQRKRAGSVR